MFGSSLPLVVCGRAHVLFVLLAHSGVQHILCCFSLYCVPVLPVSLDCPFLIASLVFYNVY